MREPLTVLSLFSGAMGLDLGLEQAGFDVRLCVEMDKDCCETIRRNRPHLPLIDRDITTVSMEEMLAQSGLSGRSVFCVAGGPPCQSFSSGGKRAAVNDVRGSLFLEFVRVVRETNPLYFIFENVAQIVTAALRHRPITERPGRNWNLSAYSQPSKARTVTSEDDALPLEAEELSGTAIRFILDTFASLGYYLTFGVVNAADYGVPQRRLRFFMLGSRVTTNLSLPAPTHASSGATGLRPWVTLRDALRGLADANPLHSSYTDDVRRFFAQVPPGGNWRHLPPNLQPEALGDAYEAGGGKTGFFRRLAWDEPAPTIIGKPNRKSSAICHPDYLRPLTVRECARLQQFPDDWQFVGGMHTQYTQIGNAVPVGLGQAIGRAILNAHLQTLQDGAPIPNADGLAVWRRDRIRMLEQGRTVLRHSARNRSARVQRGQLPLFSGME